MLRTLLIATAITLPFALIYAWFVVRNRRETLEEWTHRRIRENRRRRDAA